ncbi:MAG TPA: thioredoxin domain-containing protein [Allosphingosinicella sp.]|jgi:protein-disulfide isomerase
MINRLAILAVGAAAAALAPQAAAAPARKAAAPAAVDWSKRVAATPEGGFVMGNPAAKVKVVEYGSLTCPHCAAFSNSAKAALASQVRTGKVSFEFRNYVLNGIDIAATLVARCGGTARFFPLSEKLYATQKAWTGRINSLPQAQQAQLKAMADGPRLVRLAQLGGMTQLAAQSGLPAARTNACLANPASLKRVIAMAEAAEAIGVEGTPTFFINGRNVGTHDWESLEPLIRQAGG